MTISTLPKISETAEIVLTFTNLSDRDMNSSSYESISIDDIPNHFHKYLTIGDNFEYLKNVYTQIDQPR